MKQMLTQVEPFLPCCSYWIVLFYQIKRASALHIDILPPISSI